MGYQLSIGESDIILSNLVKRLETDVKQFELCEDRAGENGQYTLAFRYQARKAYALSLLGDLKAELKIID